jgi:hypothetical protein
MCETERQLGTTAFFMMDENFLLYRKRALELLDVMKARGKAWSLYVFSSANAIKKYEIRQLVELGIEWIWLGLESGSAAYAKLKGTDTLELARTLQSHGIRVHGSTIIGLDTSEIIDDEIAHAVAHDTVFHQFMLYTPCPARRFFDRLNRRADWWQTSIWPTFTDSSSSTSTIRRSRATTPKRFSIGGSEIERELGGLSPAIDRLAGPLLLWSARREARCGPRGRRREPRTFVERRNWAQYAV